ncbi:hypothetical protein [Natrialba asiatica]|uniref:Uncharacterized protein n=1 Tax=Natrialba asiatica (strain ATCC 700177 / DSM 12278 / JCM 9576 / FERM P-10747 / NBRC 102637 / 172P1) TaxID=29540 RepID=M0AGV7_NATA1|nr:hypothetical protein [Natrialba asiatica]ELY97127.1 hypothetical protein C481_21101 [Natrialba asiatica DSM 12278]
MGDEQSDKIDQYEVTMSHTAKSKEFRYLKAWEIEEHIHDPNTVYYNPQRDQYLIPVYREVHNENWNHGQDEKIVIIVSIVDGGTRAIVVTQTSDHYDWSRFEKVNSLGEG